MPAAVHRGCSSAHSAAYSHRVGRAPATVCSADSMAARRQSASSPRRSRPGVARPGATRVIIEERGGSLFSASRCVPIPTEAHPSPRDIHVTAGDSTERLGSGR